MPNSKKEAIISKYKWLNQLEEVQKQLHRFVDSLARKRGTKFMFKQNFFRNRPLNVLRELLIFQLELSMCSLQTCFIHVLWISSVSPAGVFVQSVSVCRRDEDQMDFCFS